MLYFYVRHFFDEQIFIDLSSAVAVDLSSFDIKDFICQLISKIEQGLSVIIPILQTPELGGNSTPPIQFKLNMVKTRGSLKMGYPKF